MMIDTGRTLRTVRYRTNSVRQAAMDRAATPFSAAADAWLLPPASMQEHTPISQPTDFKFHRQSDPPVNVRTGIAKANAGITPGQNPTLVLPLCLAEHKQLQVMRAELREMV